MQYRKLELMLDITKVAAFALSASLCFAGGSAAASIKDVDGEIGYTTCKLEGKSYAVGSTMFTKDGLQKTCKRYDAIIPAFAKRLEKGHAYWENQALNGAFTPTNNP